MCFPEQKLDTPILFRDNLSLPNGDLSPETFRIDWGALQGYSHDRYVRLNLALDCVTNDRNETVYHRESAAFCQRMEQFAADDTTTLEDVREYILFFCDHRCLKYFRKSLNLLESLKRNKANGICGFYGIDKLEFLQQLQRDYADLSNEELDWLVQMHEPIFSPNPPGPGYRNHDEFKVWLTERAVAAGNRPEINERVQKIIAYIDDENRPKVADPSSWFQSEFLNRGWLNGTNAFATVVNYNFPHEYVYGAVQDTNVINNLYHRFTYDECINIASHPYFLNYQDNHFGLEYIISPEVEIARVEQAFDDLVHSVWTQILEYRQFQHSTHHPWHPRIVYE